MDVKATQIFRRYFTANGADDVLQQSTIRRQRRRHISISVSAETTRQITPSLRHGDVLQQSAIRRHRRRHISISCFAESTRQITSSLRLCENEGFTRVLNGRENNRDISQIFHSKPYV